MAGARYRRVSTHQESNDVDPGWAFVDPEWASLGGGGGKPSAPEADALGAEGTEGEVCVVYRPGVLVVVLFCFLLTVALDAKIIWLYCVVGDRFVSI